MKQHIAKFLTTGLALLALIVVMAGTAQAIPTGYSIYGYTNSFLVNDGADGDAFGFFGLNLTGGTVVDKNTITGLTASFNFGMDLDPAYSSYFQFLPGGGTTFSGTLTESYDLLFDGTNIFLNDNDPLNPLPNLIALNNPAGGFPANFDLVTMVTSPLYFAPLSGLDYGEFAGTLADGAAVAFTVDEANYVPTPEPSTFVLLGIGVAGVVCWRRKQQQKAA